MSYRLKRPQNECLEENCKYQWMPKGKDKSNKCPNCGSRNVQIVPVPPFDWSGCFGCLFILIAIPVVIYLVIIKTNPGFFKELSGELKSRTEEQEVKEAK